VFFVCGFKDEVTNITEIHVTACFTPGEGVQPNNITLLIELRFIDTSELVTSYNSFKS
jgi:hypothetical protein